MAEWPSTLMAGPLSKWHACRVPRNNGTACNEPCVRANTDRVHVFPSCVSIFCSRDKAKQEKELEKQQELNRIQMNKELNEVAVLSLSDFFDYLPLNSRCVSISLRRGAGSFSGASLAALPRP